MYSQCICIWLALKKNCNSLGYDRAIEYVRECIILRIVNLNKTISDEHVCRYFDIFLSEIHALVAVAVMKGTIATVKTTCLREFLSPGLREYVEPIFTAQFCW